MTNVTTTAGTNNTLSIIVNFMIPLWAFQSGSYSDLQGSERRYSTPLHLQGPLGGTRDDAYAFSSSPSLQYHSAHASPNMGIRGAAVDRLGYSYSPQPQSLQPTPSHRPHSQVRLCGNDEDEDWHLSSV